VRIPPRTLLVAWAGLATIVAGLVWWQAASDPDVRLASTRDVVLDAGSRALVELSTIAAADADAGLDRWERAATGPLLDQLREQRDQNLAAVRAAGTTRSVRLLRAAVTEVDLARGTARVIAALEVTENPAAPSRTRLDGQLVETPDGWKVAAVEAVGVSTGKDR
jgi:Mce-associated membrane protein